MSALAIEVARDFSDIRDKIADIKLPGWERPVLSSYDQYIGRRVSEQPENVWIDVELSAAHHSTHEVEEERAVQIALEKLRERGINIRAQDCEVLHGREFRYDQERPYEVDKSKILLVLAGKNHLVSIHDGSSCGINGAREKMMTEGFSADALNIARLILEKSLDTLPQVELGFDRCVAPLLKKVARETLSDPEYEQLASIYLAVEYIRRRVSMMRSGVARSASLSLNKVDSTTQQTLGPGLDSLLELFNSHEDTCKQLSDSIKWTWQLHSDLLKRRAIEEQDEANQIQALAEERKQRSDARWQLLGGISVPLGLGLAVIQSFQLSSGVGIGIMAVTSLVSAALVYFRNDDFSWLYSTRTDRWPSFIKSLRGILKPE